MLAFILDMSCNLLSCKFTRKGQGCNYELIWCKSPKAIMAYIYSHVFESETILFTNTIFVALPRKDVAYKKNAQIYAEKSFRKSNTALCKT
jgi:hypothetical protein